MSAASISPIISRLNWNKDPSGFFVFPETQIPGWRLLTTTKALGNMQIQTEREVAFPKININHKNLISGFQVHGRNIGVIRSSSDVPLERAQATDGWIALKMPGIALGIYTADCVPLFLAAKDASVMAALHVGWRGLVGGIINQAVNHLKEEFGLAANKFEAIIGPHIGGCCYEVGPEVAAQFPPESLRQKNGKTYLSLESAVGVSLHQLGVMKVYGSPWCTRCSDEALFFSYRRQDKGCQLSLAVAI